jgi:pyruvate ferredoxin oxidoreductase delta subunit
MYCPEGIVTKSIPVKIDYDYCKGCGICAEECPAKAIRMVAEQNID